MSSASAEFGRLLFALQDERLMTGSRPYSWWMGMCKCLRYSIRLSITFGLVMIGNPGAPIMANRLSPPYM